MKSGGIATHSIYSHSKASKIYICETIYRKRKLSWKKRMHNRYVDRSVPDNRREREIERESELRVAQ